MSMIEIDVDDEQTLQLWAAVGELAEWLPGEWTLIGGLMVQLHAVEHGIADVRPTFDVDILGQARPQHTLGAIDVALRDAGFELIGPDLDGYAHRYQRGKLVVDVLAPDGIKPPARLGAGRKAVGVPGGSQALSRSEAVMVTVRGRTFELRRPTLLGAVLIKARSLMVHSDPATQREDLLRLLALIDDPRAMAAELRKTERTWLRAAEGRLRLSEPSTLDAEDLRRATLAYRLLTRA
ncbi:MAG TPA: hypothetical protein VK506_15800 [Conexibacter sp.]|nr:hypothetical protein [Conexibacter sp.]